MDTKLSKAAQLKLDRDYAIEKLHEHYLTPGAIVYTLRRHISSSGLSQDISLYVVNNNKLENITYYAAHALGERIYDIAGHRAIRQQGGGMDMGFNLVYNLSSVLYAGQDRAGYVLNHEWA
jgi:hypothetical protein